MSSSKSYSYPRPLCSIALSVGVLALFLIIASIMLVSYPLGSTLHGYLLGPDRYMKTDSILLNHKQTDVLPSSLDHAQNTHEDIVIKEPSSDFDVPMNSVESAGAATDGVIVKGDASTLGAPNITLVSEFKDIPSPSSFDRSKNIGTESSDDDLVSSENTSTPGSPPLSQLEAAGKHDSSKCYYYPMLKYFWLAANCALPSSSM